MTNSLLDAREERWHRRLQKAARLPSGFSLVTLTLRMPAPLRLQEPWDGSAREILADLLDFLKASGIETEREEFTFGEDGPEGFFRARGEVKRVKEGTVAFEETHPLGPLADVDVMDSGGLVTGRRELKLPPRKCLLCARPAAECVVERSHSLEELKKRIEEILEAWRSTGGNTLPGEQCGRIARYARLALLLEAAAWPKPGLVDPLSRGAHGDMDYLTFLASAAALAPRWERFVRLGADFCGDDPADLLPGLRQEGKEAEAAMFEGTGGINTHKGLIFSLGILCAASGMLAREGTAFCPQECCAQAAGIVRGISERDFAAARRKERGSLTAGERLFVDLGITGIRGEAEKGFPSVTGHALPRLQSDLGEGLSMNDAMVNALLVLFTVSEDTNVLARCGTDGAALLKKKGAEALAAGGMKTPDGRAAVHALDVLFTESNLSPGGCADLLAVTVFLHLLCPEDTGPEVPY